MRSRGSSRAANSKVNHMAKQKSETTSERSKSPKSREPEWVVADEEASAEPRVEREPIDEPELDVVQHAPAEPVWLPTEPQDAPDAADAPRVAKKAPRAAGAKPGRVAGKAPTTSKHTVATDAASASDEPAPNTPAQKPKRASKRSATQPDAAEGASTQGDAGERKGTLADEQAGDGATAPMETSAAAPLTKKHRLEQFVAERAEQHARERANEPATEGGADLAADRSLEQADEAPRHAGPVAKRERAKAASEQPVSPPAVLEPETPLPIADAAVTTAEAPTEPASTLPSMETYIAELATMSVAQLSKRHVEVLGKKPRIKNRVWLQRKLAWHEQTRRFGGLSGAAKKKLDELMGEIELPAPTSRTAKAEAPAQRSADDMPLGTRLERKWRDRVIVATRVEGGWSCEGTTYRTLSAAAKAVSGTHCSGPAFFGIWKPKGGGAR
jgi:hypothetical protein